jgi:hypothetical protein
MLLIRPAFWPVLLPPFWVQLFPSCSHLVLDEHRETARTARAVDSLARGACRLGRPLDRRP